MSRQITLAEAAQHDTKKSLYLVIHDKVYDVTSFVDEHPGGEEVLLDEAGKDATEAFEDIGHSDEARELLKKYYVGDFKSDSNTSKKEVKKTTKSVPKSSSEPQGNALRILIPVVIVGGWLAYRYLGPSN